MAILDARKLDTARDWTADVCIAGAGPAGLTLAQRLENAGLTILLIESGSSRFDREVQSLYDLTLTGHPQRDTYLSRLRYFGGSGNIWGGRCMQLQDRDFEQRQWVPWSGWPIVASELEGYYAEARRQLALPAVGGSLFEEGCVTYLTDKERKLLLDGGLSPTMAMFGRAPERFGRSCRNGFQHSSRVNVLLNLNVVKINLEDLSQRVRSLTARTLAGESFELRARAFVVACGGLETPRILLASRDKQLAGVGNEHDLVGRFYMDHPRTVYGRVRLKPGQLNWLASRQTVKGGRLHMGLQATHAVQEKLGLLNHYLTIESKFSTRAEHNYPKVVQLGKYILRYSNFCGFFHISKAQTKDLIYLVSPNDVLPEVALNSLKRLGRVRGAGDGQREYVLVYNCEQPPNPASRVSLGRDTDQLGLNRLVLDWRIESSVDESVFELQNRLGRALAAQQLGHFEPGEGRPVYTDSSHHMGTVRMSSSPRTGVVNTDCQLHGVDNLFVAGSAVFPTAGHSNPTLTILALTHRLADHLESRLRRPQETIDLPVRQVA